MPPRTAITPFQLDVLRRVDSDDPSERPTAGDAKAVYALRERGLVTTATRTGYWLATVTEAGRAVISSAGSPQSATSADSLPPEHVETVEDLVEALRSGGGRFTVDAPDLDERRRWRRMLAAAQKHDAVPSGTRIRHAGRDSGDLAIWFETIAPPPVEAADVPIPSQVRNPHPAVAALRDVPVGADGWIDTLGDGDVAQVRVHRDRRRRALLLVHAICVEAERRGHDLTVTESTAQVDHRRRAEGLRIVIEGHPMRFSVIEETDRVRHVATKAELDDVERNSWKRIVDWERVPSGRLVIRDGKGSAARVLAADRKRWCLEDRLGRALAALEGDAAAASQRVGEREQRRAARQLEWERAMEGAAQLWFDHRKGEHLIALAAGHRAASDIRAVVAAAGDDTDPQWRQWATRHADRIDPIASGCFAPPEVEEPELAELQPFMRQGFSVYDPQRRPFGP